MRCVAVREAVREAVHEAMVGSFLKPYLELVLTVIGRVPAVMLATPLEPTEPPRRRAKAKAVVRMVGDPADTEEAKIEPQAPASKADTSTGENAVIKASAESSHHAVANTMQKTGSSQSTAAQHGPFAEQKPPSSTRPASPLILFDDDESQAQAALANAAPSAFGDLAGLCIGGSADTVGIPEARRPPVSKAQMKPTLNELGSSRTAPVYAGPATHRYSLLANPYRSWA